MPSVSAKRKATNKTNCQNILKWWRKNKIEQGESPQQPSFSSPLGNHVSSASYRRSLLPREEREANQTIEDSVMIMIALQRMKTLLCLMKCKCHIQVISQVIVCKSEM